ncbi:MAG: hypothetical protein JRI87_02085 [Deltaproteobacteria bacterium]|jgi:hypothetical protein|nr:hypothetical protein [Deltaproteobacteria bacterium]MBW2182509.1 hypothetical protein [Deltaproteobacteria bacterium]
MRKIISLVISIIYLVAAYSAGGAAIFFKVLVFLLFPVAFIWFGDAMVNYKRSATGGRPITKELPGCLIRLAGWILLLLPGIIIFISIVTVKR